jgi:hypothetical protein
MSCSVCVPSTSEDADQTVLHLIGDFISDTKHLFSPRRINLINSQWWRQRCYRLLAIKFPTAIIFEVYLQQLGAAG